MLRGINLAGAEFGEQHIPGTFGTHYTYPDAAAFQRFRSYGFDCIRLPFRWERLQPDVDADLDPVEWQRLSAAIDAARRAGQTIILDVHNSARRRVRADGFQAEHMIGSAHVPLDALARFWERLARATLDQPHVIHGIMNEPADIAPGLWLEIANRTIAAIRATGARQLILAPGVDWTGAHSWYRSGNTLMRRLVDPAHNLAIDVHQYLDTDSSGRSGRSVSATIGSERLEAFQEWARRHRLKAFLGEFGAGADPTSVAALTDMLIEVERNPDVWIGWTAWAAGPWWPPDEPLRLEPHAAGVLPAQTSALMRFTQASRLPGDVIEGSEIDLDLTRAHYHGAARLEDVIDLKRPAAGWALARSGHLEHFAAAVPRRTDLGLWVEAGAADALHGVEPVLVRTGGPGRTSAPRKASLALPGIARPAFLLGPPQTILRWQPGAKQAAALARAAAGSVVSFGVHVASDPLRPGTLAIAIGATNAEIDLARRTARMISGHGAVSISGSGHWRRVTLTLPAAAVPANGAVSLRRTNGPDAKSTAASAVEATAASGDVAVCAPMLCAGAASATWADPARVAEEAVLAGRLAELLRTPAFTLFIETRGLTPLPIDLPLIGDSAGPWLLRGGDGGLRSPRAGHATTGPIGAHAWEPRRRAVLVVDRDARRTTLATTGEMPATHAASWPDAAAGTIMLGGIPGEQRRLDGLVTRLAVIPHALAEDAAALLAGR